MKFFDKKHWSFYFALGLLFQLSALSFTTFAAEQNMQKLGNLNVHYIALNSTFLTPEIAKAYEITRSKYNALINISVLDNTIAGTPAKSVTLTGTATNLLGQIASLDFIEVKEGDAIYYLAELKFSNEDLFRFDININDGNNRQQLKFQHTLYVD